MVKRRNEKRDDSVESDLAKMQKLEAAKAKKEEREKKRAEKAAKKAAKKEGDNANKPVRGNLGLEAIKEKRKEFKESREAISKSSNGKKYQKIKTSIMVAFCVPVILIIILGVVSYETASDAVVEKYKTSAKSTITATKSYLNIVCNDVQLKATALATDDNVVRYYKSLYKNGMQETNAKKHTVPSSIVWVVS